MGIPMQPFQSQMPVPVAQTPIPVLGAPGLQQPQVPISTNDPVTKLQQLNTMLDMGLVTQAEFDAKKAEIMASM